MVIQGQQSQTYGTSQHKGAIKAPIAPLESKIQANGSAEPIDQTPERPRAWGLKFWCETNASDFFVGLFTLLLGIATYFLWRETERLATGADDQAAATEKALKISKQSADAATAGLRPWLKIDAQRSGGLHFNERGMFLDIQVAVSNVGKSPATRVKVSTGLGAANRLFKTEPSNGLFDPAEMAVNKAQISNSERVSYDRGRSVEELARLQTIGDVVFPGEARPIPTNDWGVSGAELKQIIRYGDGTAMVAVFLAVSVEYLFSGSWGVTTVVYAIERGRPPVTGVGSTPDDSYRFWDSTVPLHGGNIVFRKLPIRTTAT